MTTDFTKPQLATILSALDEERRNPANKTVALKAIANSASRSGLTAEDVLGAADGLIDGRLSPAEFRAELRDLAVGEHEQAAEAAGEQAEPAPGAWDNSPDMPEFLRRKKAAATSEEQPSEPAEAAEEATAAAEPADAAEPAAPTTPAEPKAAAKGRRAPREGTKQAQVIAMLRRPEGATVDEIAAECAWQRHTVRGAMAGALKKKLGLTIESEKDEKRGRVYRIRDAA